MGQEKGVVWVVVVSSGFLALWLWLAGLELVRAGVTAVSYTLSFSPNQFLDISHLSVNDQPADMLDRQKIRAQVTVPIVGPIRAVGGSGEQGFAFYSSKADLNLSFPLADIPVAPFTVAHFDYIQLSLDLNDPTTTGMAAASYFNRNGAGVPNQLSSFIYPL